MAFRRITEVEPSFPGSHSRKMNESVCIANRNPIHGSAEDHGTGLLGLFLIILGIILIISPVHADQYQANSGDVTEITQNSVFILKDLSDPITLDQINTTSETLMKKVSSKHKNNQFVVGRSDITNEGSVVAFAMTVDDSGIIHQFIGRARGNADVPRIHDQANAWKNDSLARYLDKEFPVELIFPRSSTLMNSEDPDSSIAIWKSTNAHSYLPYGETIGQYSMKKIIAGNTWDLFGIKTDIVTIPGTQIADTSDYSNAETRVTHLWEGSSPKTVPLGYDPSGTEVGKLTGFGSFYPAENISYRYCYAQTNSTVYTTHANNDPSFKWTLNASASFSPAHRSEFSPVSIVSIKKPLNHDAIKSYTLMTINTSATFSVPNENKDNGNIQDFVMVDLVNPQTTS